MAQVIGKTTFFSLPTELRLEIAAYALEQPNAGLTREHRPGGIRNRFSVDNGYKSSTNLAIRLVCRQFNADFRRLSIQNTLFVLPKDSTWIAHQQSDEFLRNVKKLRARYNYNDITEWKVYPMKKPCMHLDQLELVITLEDSKCRKALVGLFRRLQNVKQIRLLACGNSLAWGSHEYIKLLGEILKEDHYQRYDAPNAPNLGDTWWEWSYRDDLGQAIFVAQQPKPIMMEEDYMLLMKPRVDYIMDCMVAYST
ncbi:hypothetical protein G6011_06064 [Alternaria panax]|uniref:Uncharacterized protein n=1 Tax=Alternaria panax TaxID=48097 RepID=A0AAD4FI95_9PLEO|nr:hypothetical protein G6011_06064 [Alternaria panax]